ncbi:unnamed protein product [Parnassius mnemosyne]|uniref:Integrase catalytic domain-containing protein n=1 Tax=Parnassius mnemosyne TaxID=213953 RepID=A0AAV1LV16_9NEOP
MDDIQQLSRGRAAHKGKLTQFTNFIDNLSTPLNADGVINLELRIENVIATYDKFDSIQTKIESLSEDTDTQILERAKFEELYFDSLTRAKESTTTPQGVQLGPTGDSPHKILGLEWSNQNDNLNYSINLQPIPNNVTKRVILSRVSSIFDPLGLLGPSLILAECFIQRLWVAGSDWDQPISQTLLKDWLTFYNSLQYQRLLQIARSQATGNNAYYGRPTRSQSATSTTIYTVVLDYAGPFLLKDRHGHGYKTYKSYIAIFICSSTKAVHIELVTGLETHSFLSAFRRFIARRGKPRVVVSDNGTTFRGADRELRKLYDFLNTSSNELTTSCTEQGIVWKFVPSYSPHMNGLAEGAVKSCKYHLKRVLKQSLLTYEGFSTVLIQIEGIFNSRPLCPIPFSDSEVFQVLTPAHFLIGRTPVAIPDYQYDEVPTNRLKYFQQLQQIYQSFWKGFSRDYVGLLQQRGKWQSSKGPTLAAGSIVLIKDKHTPPCHWRLARIIETHPGGDGVTRVATLKTSQGSSIKLSFTKICPLPIQDNH